MRLLGTREYRLYGSADPVGAQVGGAAKNVIAIAAGIAIGAGLGENARAALVTRGVAEIARLAVALGGRAETVSGLSGLGDLMLTCAGGASRNFRLGLAIGGGAPPAAARAAIGAAVEGVEAAPALLAARPGRVLPDHRRRRGGAGGAGERGRRDGRAAGSSGSRRVARCSRHRPRWTTCVRYAEPHRAYHTQTHVDTMLAGLRGCRSPAGVAELAIWYHDAIYDPAATRQRGPQRRADAGGPGRPGRPGAAGGGRRHDPRHRKPRCCRRARARTWRCSWTWTWPCWARAPDAYDAYERGIAAEYVPVHGEGAFRRGRAAFKRGMLARPRLFLSDHFHAALDAAARNNLRREP